MTRVSRNRYEAWQQAPFQHHGRCHECGETTHVRRSSKRVPWRCVWCFLRHGRKATA